MQTMATCKSEQQGGYNCEFVEQPPKYLQVECPVCLQILRDPYVISCCGYYYCWVCIERVQDDNKPCPTCNGHNFTVLANKGHQRMLNGFVVRCSNEKDGCKWTGELGSLDTHINANPEDTGKQLDGCDYTQVNCAYCDNSFKRIEIENHQKNDCPKRPFTCEYCLTYKTNYDDVVNSHWSMCGSKPVPCANKCGENPLRKDFDNHIADACPLTQVECEFLGCDVKIPRKAMPEHLQKEQGKHISLLASHVVSLTKCNQDLLKTCTELKDENKSFRERVAALEDVVVKLEEANRNQIAPTKPGQGIWFKMANVSQHVQLYKTQKFSPFYTHHCGYKMYFEAGFERRIHFTYFAVRVYLTQGEFDDDLKWPVKGRFEVHLKNCETNTYDNLKTFKFVANRQIRGQQVHLNINQTYTIHAPVPPNYIANDCLYLRITFFFE